MSNDQSGGTPPPAPEFSSKDVICRARAGDAQTLVEKLVRLAAANHPVGDAGAAIAAVRARMESAPVVVATGVAVPHARIDGLGAACIAIATVPDGIAFGDSGDPVKLAILVLTPADAPAGYLRIAAYIARFVASPGFVDRVCSLSDPAAVAAEFGFSDLPPGGNATARDLMMPPPAVLHETNSIKDAIDVIVRTGLPEVPVVDKEGDLVGVASARAILRVCMPDYLLWMEDLSRFSNFEPFGTLLRKESSTWLADITDDDFPSVSADGPAIAVAEALARHGADTCYVVDGARLAGVVTLPRFLHNVFRD